MLITLRLYCYPQLKQKFEIDGIINHTNFTKIFLEPIVFGKKYYSIVVNDTSGIINNTFSFNGLIPYPHPFRLSCYDSSSKIWVVSEIFFIQQGKQSIQIDSLTDNMVISLKNSSSNNEFISGYLKQVHPLANEWSDAFNKIDSVYDALDGKVADSVIVPMHNDADRIKNKLDTFIFSYTKQHPDSYIALWKLIQKFHTLGYASIYSRTYNLFSDSIKYTYAAKELSKALKAASMTAIGNAFPHISLVNNENKKVQLLITGKNYKYVLLDFWYSHCGPCIAQFDRLKATYNKFKPFGFEIISISTDKNSDRQDWKDAINKYQLLWTHFLDVDGNESLKLSINSFPTNFLLDKNGKVIAKDLDPSQLNKFLTEKLSN